MDHGVGEVIKSLKKSGMFDNSVILFSTDNGAWDNYPLRGTKGDLYEGAVRGVGLLSGGALPTRQSKSKE